MLSEEYLKEVVTTLLNYKSLEGLCISINQITL